MPTRAVTENSIPVLKAWEGRSFGGDFLFHPTVYRGKRSRPLSWSDEIIVGGKGKEEMKATQVYYFFPISKVKGF